MLLFLALTNSSKFSKKKIMGFQLSKNIFFIIDQNFNSSGCHIRQGIDNKISKHYKPRDNYKALVTCTHYFAIP